MLDSDNSTVNCHFLKVEVHSKLRIPQRKFSGPRRTRKFSSRFQYRNVRKNWDTQRIGTRLKIVKIIIVDDPKNWTILRKRKNIRNFSDPKNWDGVFGAPK